MRLGTDFWARHTVEAARELIGCRMIRRHQGHTAIVTIVETEAYRGGDDPASHAHRGITPRNRIMFGPPGRLYVYLSYGMHYCMNIVTEQDGVPGAVLLRGAIPAAGSEWIRANRPRAAERQWMNGPGKLAQALAVDLGMNGLDLTDPSQDALIVTPGDPLPCTATPRIGITKGTHLPWRFIASP